MNLLYLYAPEDQQWRDEIDLRFRDLKRDCGIGKVFDIVLWPDIQQDESFLTQLRSTHLVLVLVSAHFTTTHFVPLPKVRDSLDWLRWSGNCLVIAFLLEQVDWDGAPFASKNVFPCNVRPLTDWQSREQGFQDIETDMRGAIEKQWQTRGDWLAQEACEYEEAFKAYDEVLRLNPLNKWAWYGKGNMLSEQEHHEEALNAYDEALRIDPLFSWAWYCKGNAFAGRKCYEEALKAYDEAIRLDSTNMHTWYWKGEALKALKRRREAQLAKRKAHQLGWPI